MELVLIRHAQPAWRGAKGLSTNNPGLTRLGRSQAAALATWIGRDHRRVDGLFVSTAKRSLETATRIGQTLGRDPVVQPWAVEIGAPGEWEGKPEDEVTAVLASLKSRPLNEWWDGTPGGESFRDFHQRITSGVDGFLGEFGAIRRPDDPRHLWEIPDGEQRLMLVAHAGTNSVITSHLLGLEPQPWEWERFPCDHASITVLRSRPIAQADMWALEYFSDVAHLPADQVTA